MKYYLIFYLKGHNMSTLTLVKPEAKETEIRENLPEWAKAIYSVCDKPGLNIIKHWEGKDAELKEIAHRELMLIKNSIDLSEGKIRLFEKASKAFQIFIDAKNIKSESKKMQSTAYDILLYYIDKLYPGVDLELDEDNNIIFQYEKQEPSDKGIRLLKYLLESWIELTDYQVVTAYDMMLSFHTVS